MKKLYLVDVSSMFFRAFYAIRALTNPAGVPVNAVYGYLSMTVKLLREIKPDYLAFCYDRAEPSFRVTLDPNYKAHRKEMPEDLVPQIPYIKTLATALGIPQFDKKDYEADDVIGTLTKFGRDNGLEVVIVSSDKDFAQLIRPCVTMYDTMKEIRYDEAKALDKWGVETRKMIDYLAIVGDASDNVPGVKGIGEKGAQKLLQEFDSLEDIYAGLDKISSASTRKKLEESRDQAFMSKKLVTIVCDVPLDVSVEDLKMKPIEREMLQNLLAELDFKSFARTLLGEGAPGSTVASIFSSQSPAAPRSSVDSIAEANDATTSRTGVTQGSQAIRDGFAEGATSRAPQNGGKGADELIPWIKDAAPVGQPMLLQVETSKKPTAASFTRAAQPLPVAVEAAPIELGTVTEDRLDLSGLDKWLTKNDEVWAIHTERGSFLAKAETKGHRIVELAVEGKDLGQLLSEKSLRYKGFNLKDFCKRHHIAGPKIEWDQQLAAYVVRAGPIDDVLPLFSLYTGEQLPDLPSPTQLLTAHAKLESELRRRLKGVNGEHVLFEIEQPLVPILLAMETTGILLDAKALSAQSEELGTDIAALEKAIFEEAGGPFTIGSTKQLGSVLFEKLKLPTGKRTKTGFSTDVEVLQKIQGMHPIVDSILSWRELTKLKSTYVDALPEIMDPATHRVHTTYNQALAATGRLSSINPNLQNIPIRTERGNLIRKAFIADPGHSLVSADYSQIELRVLAHITEDPGLVKAFEEDRDIHAATASEIFETKLEDVTPEMRRKAKAVNFGLAYGLTAFGLAERLQISKGEASEIIGRYFSRFAGVQTYINDTIEVAKRQGYVETVFGRRRYIDELFSKSAAVRNFGERAAINAPIQGTASDLVKMAMIKVGKPEHARPLLQVHDELVLEVENEHVETVSAEVATKMENVAMFKVPLRVNTGQGANWDLAHS